VRFIQLYSCSSGNLYEIIASNGNRLLIEAGVTWSKLQKALNYNVNNIGGCLISHEHLDHSKAVVDVMRAGIDVYASRGTFEALGIKKNERRAKIVESKTLIRLKDFDVLCFDTKHDATEPLGFIVREKTTNEYLLFATDTSHIKQRFKLPFSIIAIECSYDKEILQHRVNTKDINESVAKRLLTSHMEKQETLRYLQQFVDLSKCREINLLHMSKDNIDKAQAKTEFEQKLFIETKVVRDDSYINQRI